MKIIKDEKLKKRIDVFLGVPLLVIFIVYIFKTENLVESIVSDSRILLFPIIVILLFLVIYFSWKKFPSKKIDSLKTIVSFSFVITLSLFFLFILYNLIISFESFTSSFIEVFVIESTFMEKVETIVGLSAVLLLYVYCLKKCIKSSKK